METVRSRDQANAARDAFAARCPRCGATNPVEAEWCGQCFERFATEESGAARDDAPARSDERAAARAALSDLAGAAPTTGRKPPPPPPPARSASTDKPARTTAGAFTFEGDRMSWTCGRCDAVNDFENNACSVCGATFADAIKPDQASQPTRDANTAALLSLFMPGGGHAYIGMWGQGIARAVISVWVVTVAIFAAAQSAPQAKIMGALFGVAATALWVIAAHDAYREASNAPRRVILKPKTFLYVVLGLLLMSVVMVFSTALGVRTGAGG